MGRRFGSLASCPRRLVEQHPPRRLYGSWKSPTLFWQTKLSGTVPRYVRTIRSTAATPCIRHWPPRATRSPVVTFTATQRFRQFVLRSGTEFRGDDGSTAWPSSTQRPASRTSKQCSHQRSPQTLPETAPAGNRPAVWSGTRIDAAVQHEARGLAARHRETPLLPNTKWPFLSGGVMFHPALER